MPSVTRYWWKATWLHRLTDFEIDILGPQLEPTCRAVRAYPQKLANAIHAIQLVHPMQDVILNPEATLLSMHELMRVLIAASALGDECGVIVYRSSRVTNRRFYRRMAYMLNIMHEAGKAFPVVVRVDDREQVSNTELIGHIKNMRKAVQGSVMSREIIYRLMVEGTVNEETIDR